MSQTLSQRDVQSLLNNIASVLEEIIEETNKLDTCVTKFHSIKIPAIDIDAYLFRIAKYSKASEQCFVLALIYLDRIQELNTSIILNSYCIHRFLIVAIMIAIKFYDDEYYKNEYYAKIGGITIKEMSELEKEFLDLIQYQLYVDQEFFRLYEQRLYVFQP
ncbi:hypothetical protein pb186bvf_013875 [Paramecium bursaria]